MVMVRANTGDPAVDAARTGSHRVTRSTIAMGTISRMHTLKSHSKNKVSCRVPYPLCLVSALPKDDWPQAM